MGELRFDGRVAVVTGAGRGLGRAYAHLLAARGASVVVNDLGSSIDGQGADAGPAQAVVDEITASGGAAVADGRDIATPSGAEGLVARALDRFGRLDVVVANAGIMRWAVFPNVSVEDLEQHLAVHTLGSFLVTQAAWPHLAAQEYGRIVLTTSTGVLGLPGNTAYGIAKGGVIGLLRSLALAGAPLGITANGIAPAAATRMAGTDRPDMASELVAPMVGYLAHEDCPVNGEIYTAGAGRFARLFVGSTQGAVVTGEPTIEDVRARWAAINDPTDFDVPADLMAWSAQFLSHLPKDPGS